jgi:hypothetical protein
VPLWQTLGLSTESLEVDVDKRKKELFVSQNKKKVTDESTDFFGFFL